ncbi:MAG TPA: hypothetical protein VKS60_25225 [Stellaceae bacterium]|nr:hypothetical protein [Stellaceae bacterium]
MILASIGGSLVWCLPAEAAAVQAEFRTLSAADGTLLAAFAEAIVPGAADAGCAHFIDHHVGVAPAESLLSLRYLDVAPPYAAFYGAGLAALRQLAGPHPDWDATIRRLQAPSLAGWQGPPPGLFYFAVRSDAVDAVYGTRAGFKRLGIEYLAHIEPETDW